jgi:hypothetical protein
MKFTKATFEKKIRSGAGYKPFKEVKIEDAAQSPIMIHPGCL